MSPEWQAVARELGLALEHVAQGVLALARANYQRPAEYHRAFFSLSVGLERLTKLAIALDYALTNGGAYPGEKLFRGYGHDIAKLLDAVDEVVKRRGFATPNRPNSLVHQGIVRTLTQFATNITRYYNLDLLAGKAKAADPIATWWSAVREPILAKHLSPAEIARMEAQGIALGLAMEEFVLIRGHLETGLAFDSLDVAIIAVEQARRAIPWERMYVLQIVRWLSEVLLALHDEGTSASLDLPYFVDFLGIYLNDDAYFRRRKSWSFMSP